MFLEPRVGGKEELNMHGANPYLDGICIEQEKEAQKSRPLITITEHEFSQSIDQPFFSGGSARAITSDVNPTDL
jgi:hypothetical protein